MLSPPPTRPLASSCAPSSCVACTTITAAPRTNSSPTPSLPTAQRRWWDVAGIDPPPWPHGGGRKAQTVPIRSPIPQQLPPPSLQGGKPGGWVLLTQGGGLPAPTPSATLRVHVGPSPLPAP